MGVANSPPPHSRVTSSFARLLILLTTPPVYFPLFRRREPANVWLFCSPLPLNSLMNRLPRIASSPRHILFHPAYNKPAEEIFSYTLLYYNNNDNHKKKIIYNTGKVK